MPQQLPLYPQIPAYSYVVALDEVQYRLHFAWNDTRASWYLGIDDALGTPLLRGKRIVPFCSHTRGLVPGGPRGILTAIGDNPYARDELTLLYITEAELADLPSVDEDDGRVVLIAEPPLPAGAPPRSTEVLQLPIPSRTPPPSRAP